MSWSCAILSPRPVPLVRLVLRPRLRRLFFRILTRLGPLDLVGQTLHPLVVTHVRNPEPCQEPCPSGTLRHSRDAPLPSFRDRRAGRRPDRSTGPAPSSAS